MAKISQRVTPVDCHVAARLKQRRVALGLGQVEVGAVVGCSYQQANKYETAQNRLSAGVLWKLSCALDTPIEWFFEGLTDEPEPASPRVNAQMRLARVFLAIENPAHQEAILELSKMFAATSNTKSAPEQHEAA